MSGRRSRSIALFVALVAVGFPAVASLPLDPTVASVTRDQEILSYPVRDAAGDAVGERSWRVIAGTGNCCENHIVTTPDGRILDIGGDSILIGTQDGRFWQEVQLALQVGGEGSLTNAPNGDIVGVVWDAYSGDRITAVKYDAAADEWQTALVALHRPFYDRPWVSIAPGPIEVGGVVVPYAVLLRSGYVTVSTMLVSLDGLTYVPHERPLYGTATTVTLTQPAVDWADWVQPIGHSALTPLPGGGAMSTIASLVSGSACPWQRLGGDLAWDCIKPHGGVTPGMNIARFDSRGWLHVLVLDAAADALTYRLTEDGGRTWREHALPTFGDVQAIDFADFVVNGGLDRANVALRYVQQGAHHLVVLRLDHISAATPTLEVLDVGLGDLALGGGLGSDNRMDFVSIGMLPDGRAVMSFADSAHHPPAIAVELG